MNVFNIPQHKNCTNCGGCCGIIPASIPEINTIRNYIAVNGIQPIKHKDISVCPFRDNDAKKCLIYPVRPVICRLMGVTKGMQCPNGNTCEIDGEKFIMNETTGIINLVRW